MNETTAQDAFVPFSGDDWFDPLEEAIRLHIRSFIEALVEAEAALGGVGSAINGPARPRATATATGIGSSWGPLVR